MSRTILLTGGTDGIGFETAKAFVAEGHRLLLHGRSEDKLARAREALIAARGGEARVETFRADLSRLDEVDALARRVEESVPAIDVLVNNAGVFKVPTTLTRDGHDVRLIVNTVAPWLLTSRLLPRMGPRARVVNLSSAAQAPVDVDGLLAGRRLEDGDAYAQSKLGITMWSFHLARELGARGPAIIAVNPASFLGSKMVKDAYGSDGKDLSIGVDVLRRAALGDDFADASGRYYDNDSGRFADPHPDALDAGKCARLVAVMNQLLLQLGL